jgi:protein-disulfide isomerase
LFASACVIVIALGGLQLWDRLGGGNRVDSSPRLDAVQRADHLIQLDRVTVRAVGRPPIVLAEFSDYECPFCGQYARATFTRIQREFVDTGRIAYAFVNNPIERLHPKAFGAAEAAECAGRQGKMWQMHDALFARQSMLTRTAFVSHAAGVGLDVPSFEECLSGGAAARVRAQMQIGRDLGVTGTPTFFVGYLESPQVMRTLYRVVGAISYNVFAETLEKASKETAERHLK